MSIEFTSFSKLQEMAETLARKLDKLSDGKEDNKIKGSVWNEYISQYFEGEELDKLKTDKKNIKVKDVMSFLTTRLVAKAQYREDVKKAQPHGDQKPMDSDAVLDSLINKIPKVKTEQQKPELAVHENPSTKAEKTEQPKPENKQPAVQDKPVLQEKEAVTAAQKAEKPTVQEKPAEKPVVQEKPTQAKPVVQEVNIKSKFNKTGGLKKPEKDIVAEMTVADKNGESHKVKLQIQPSYLDKKYNSPGLTMEAKLNKYLTDLKTKISAMSQEELSEYVKNDTIFVKNQAGVSASTGAKFDKSGKLENKKEPIVGTIVITDADGKKQKIKLSISPSVLSTYAESSGTEKDGYNTILRDINKAFSKLPPEVINDIVSESRSINIYPYGSGEAGFFDGETNDIHLLRGRTIDKGGGYSLSSYTIGITPETIAHETGHAIQHLHDGFQNQQELNEKFNVLKNLLAKEGIRYREDDIDVYFLKDANEGAAEYYAASRGCDSSTYMAKLANHPSAAIRKAYQDFAAVCEKGIQNSRSKTTAERMGLDKDTINDRINNYNIFQHTSDKHNESLSNLSIKCSLFTHGNKILSRYVEYLEKGKDSTYYDDIEDLADNKDWISIKSVLDEYLEKIGYTRPNTDLLATKDE